MTILVGAWVQVHVGVRDVLAAGGVLDRVQAHVRVPRPRLRDPREPNAHEARVGVEHAVERLLQREVLGDRELIDVMLLAQDLLLVVTPIPQLQPRIRIAGVRPLGRRQLRNIEICLRTYPPLQVLQKLERGLGPLRHPDLQDVVRP